MQMCCLARSTTQHELSKFVADYGWPEFRKKELELLQDLLETEKIGRILGGGVLETPQCRDLLMAYVCEGGAVVCIIRDIDEICAHLGEERARPAWGEPFEDVVKRREPWFVSYTKVLKPPNAPLHWSTESQLALSDTRRGIKDEIARYFRHISGVRTNFATNLDKPGGRLYFVSLPYPDVTEAAAVIDELTKGANSGWIFCTLKGPQPKFPPRSYVAALRQRQLSALLTVFTVRTVSQGGAFPDDAEDDAFTFTNQPVAST